MEALQEWDIQWFRRINNMACCNRVRDAVMMMFTFLGDGLVQTIVVLALAYVTGLGHVLYIKALAAMALGGLGVRLGKIFVPRRRPLRLLPDARVLGPKLFISSFPSGHTCTAFSLVVTLGHTWPYLLPLFLPVATGIGLSRIYVGAHFPLDVLSGAALGTTAGVMVLTVLKLTALV